MQTTTSQSLDAGPPPPMNWPLLFGEVMLLAILGAALAAVGSELGRTPSSQTVFVLVLGLALHGCALLRYLTRLSDFLALQCRACEQRFHAFPEQLPRALSRGCAHCGARLREPGGPQPEKRSSPAA